MNSRFRVLAALGFLPFGSVGHAQVTSGLTIQEAVRRSRTVAPMPRSEPPPWMDFERMRPGFVFLFRNSGTIVDTLRGVSLAGTFGGKDVTPVVMQTGRLPHEFTQRMHETEARMSNVLMLAGTREAFLKRNYAEAVELGQLHAAVGEEVKGALRWNPKVRVPMNGQAYGLVLYTFAWWPVETLMAQGKVDPVRDAKQLDGWFHLWSVIGYGMGVPEALLPMDYARAKTVVEALRKAQYPGKHEPRPEGVAVLLGGHVRMMGDAAYAAASKKDPASSHDAALRAAAKSLADGIVLSPGLAAALGLGSDPFARLLEYAARPVPK